MTLKIPIALAISVSLTGCMNLAPVYETPETTTVIEKKWSKDSWMNESLKLNGLIPRNIGWRDFFVDLRLQKLIETAMMYNHDLRKAALRVEIAEQKYGITRAGATPIVLSTSAKRNRSYGGRIGESYQVGLGLSNYELDFFGRVKNQSTGSLNQYLQTQEARDAAQLSIINAVAKLYYQLRVAEDLRTLAQKTLKSREKSINLIKLRFQEGLAAGTDVTGAQSMIAKAKSSYERNDRTVKQTQNALMTLIGKPLSQVAFSNGNPLSSQFPSKAIFADLPSEALLNRPDIRQAEYSLKAANANIGVARAAMYPRITLTGNLGYASPQLDDLFESPTRIWGFGPTLSLPIFDRGQRRSNIKITELQKKIVIETYKGTLQKSFQEVADALVARETLVKEYQAEQAGLAASKNTLRMVKLQVQEGLVNGLKLLDAERADYGTRQGLLAIQLQILTNHVDLYTLLGGGLYSTTAEIAQTDIVSSSTIAPKISTIKNAPTVKTTPRNSVLPVKARLRKPTLPIKATLNNPISPSKATSNTTVFETLPLK